MVKIALQISGRLRYTHASISSLMAAIVERHSPDVFCSFWQPENPDTVTHWTDYLSPIACELEDQEHVRPYLDALFPFNVHANMPSMSYKFHRVSCLRRCHELITGTTYDLVIQARSDNVFFEVLGDQILEPLHAPGIYCANGSLNPHIDAYVSPRMVDNFYLGDRASMDMAGHTFWYLREQASKYTTQGMLHHVRIPEIIQSKIWNDRGIVIRPLLGTNPFGNFHYDIDRQETPWK